MLITNEFNTRGKNKIVNLELAKVFSAAKIKSRTSARNEKVYNDF